MENLGKDCAYSDSSPQSSAAHEEYAVPDVIITRRLRDREQLRKRKMEAQEKDFIQWVLSDQKKRQRRRRGARRGRRRQAVVEINPELEQELDPEASSQEEAEPEHPESAPPEPVHQEQSPLLTTQDMVGGMQLGVVERELADRSQDSAAMSVPGEKKRPLTARHATLSCHGKQPFCIPRTGALHTSPGPSPEILKRASIRAAFIFLLPLNPAGIYPL
ncbi:hemogen isoform X2 [Chroicocephalus ridibundus]|uniref:hemogen isoform X2 n=1 Tax=Chroicocephalus ridibundus TaxID=1192867 RepID=UPI002FDD8523